MKSWCFNPDYRGREAEQRFASIEAVALEGERIAKDPISCVLRVTADGKRYYVKRYFSNGKESRRWFGLRGLIGPQRIKRNGRTCWFFAAWAFQRQRSSLTGLNVVTAVLCAVR